MKIYCIGSSAEDDMMMAKWWMRMRTDGDLDRTFLDGAHCLSGFFDVWRSNELIIDTDDEGITMAFWCQPYMGAAVSGLWIRSDRRKHLPTIRAALRAYKMVFDSGVKAIFGITKQPGLLPEHEKLGYTILGSVPGLWDCNTPAHIVVLTADNFMAKCGNRLHDDKPRATPDPLEVTDE